MSELTREVVSVCQGCLSLRADPPSRFVLADGSRPDGSFGYWFGGCVACQRPTQHDVLGIGTRQVVMMTPERGESDVW